METSKQKDTSILLADILKLSTIPKFPLELRADVFFYLFLPVIFSHKFPLLEIECIVPQFPILPKSRKEDGAKGSKASKELPQAINLRIETIT
jgi:hypothetical protein